MVKIKFAGASGGEVTGSKHLISSKYGRLLLDCGLFQGKRNESVFKNKNFSFSVSEINAVVISHAHIDHIGLLPYLVKSGFSSNIYLTPITEELARVMLIDSAKLQKEDAEFYNKIHKDDGDYIEPLYNETDVEETFKHFKKVMRGTIFSPIKDVYIKLLNAAHVLGSSYIYLDVEGVKILYSGDIGRQKQFILRPPTFNDEVDYLIIESTYGDREHPDIVGVYEKFKELIEKSVENKSKIIIPSFSLERTQEIINIFDRIRHDTNIPDIPIYVDSPMSVKITEIFNKYLNEDDYSDEFKRYASSDKDPFGYEYIHYISSQQDSKQLNFKKGPMIIISASGMCEGGRVLHHIRNSIDDINNILLLVGYQASNTLGRRLKEGAKRVKIFGLEHDVNFEVHSIDFFSSHASRSDLISYVKQINPRQGIFLVHGEDNARISLRNDLLNIGFKNIYLPSYDEEFEIN